MQGGLIGGGGEASLCAAPLKVERAKGGARPRRAPYSPADACRVGRFTAPAESRCHCPDQARPLAVSLALGVLGDAALSSEV